MTAGRPFNSITPLWRSKPAVKVAMYHFLCFLNHKEPTMYGCAKMMKISRTTAIKWFDVTKWSKNRDEQYRSVRKWILEHLREDCCYDSKLCSSELMLPEEEVFLFMEMLKIEPQYILF